MNVNDRYNNTIQEIEKRAADPFLNPQEIAEEVARSNALIMRDMAAVFKYLTGSTLRGYISERKMMASYKYLIENKERDIEHALEIAGYMDQPSYSKAFKLRFGMTPGEAFKRRDASLYAEPLTWDALSGNPASPSQFVEESAEMREVTHFGLTEAQYVRAAEAMELEAFYDFTPLISQYAFDLSAQIGKPLKETFRFVDSFRDYVEQHSEKAAFPDDEFISQEDVLHEYGDSEFYQRMFFERNISAETISYFQIMHEATEEELLECDPEMLAAYSETYDMSFHFFMKAWHSYMEYTGGEYNSEQFESFLEKIDAWMPIETALAELPYELTDADIDDALHATIDPRDEELDLYYYEIDEVMKRAYTRWDGERFDREQDADNLGYPDDEDADGMDQFTEDDDRLDEHWDEW